MIDKRLLRAELRARLAALDAEYITEGSKAIFQNVISLPQYQSAQRIFAYCSIGREVETHNIIRHALASGKALFLPVVLDRETMAFYPCEDLSALRRGPFGIPQPIPSGAPEIPLPGDLMLLPGVSFTRSGARLGQGGGYYDRYLAAQNVFTVGLCFREMISDKLPLDPHDRCADLVVTD